MKEILNAIEMFKRRLTEPLLQKNCMFTSWPIWLKYLKWNLNKMQCKQTVEWRLQNCSEGVGSCYPLWESYRFTSYNSPESPRTILFNLTDIAQTADAKWNNTKFLHPTSNSFGYVALQSLGAKPTPGIELIIYKPIWTTFSWNSFSVGFKRYQSGTNQENRGKRVVWAGHVIWQGMTL